MTRNQVAATDIQRPHVPVIVHRSGGPSASEHNVCGQCGEILTRNWVKPGGFWIGNESGTAYCPVEDLRERFEQREELES